MQFTFWQTLPTFPQQFLGGKMVNGEFFDILHDPDNEEDDDDEKNLYDNDKISVCQAGIRSGARS